jgi:hypothetical protein
MRKTQLNNLNKIVSKKQSTWLQEAELRDKHSHCQNICWLFYFSALKSIK